MDSEEQLTYQAKEWFDKLTPQQQEYLLKEYTIYSLKDFNYGYVSLNQIRMIYDECLILHNILKSMEE